MSRAQRLGLIVLAVVIAVVAFVLLRPDDEDEGEKASTATTATQGARTAPRTTPTVKPRPAPERIRIAGGKPAGGVETIRVKNGERVRFSVSSGDTSDEVHVHGYDLRKEMAPGRPVRFSFEARIEGIFEIELEGTHTQIAKLVVGPS